MTDSTRQHQGPPPSLLTSSTPNHDEVSGPQESSCCQPSSGEEQLPGSKPETSIQL
jgi:hypothetical protein